MSSDRKPLTTIYGAWVMDNPNHLNVGPPLVLDYQRIKKWVHG
ncbi:hypothetical protein [Dyella caseinilytica]|nr:hypothetical protein [Dyella caseinilytica]GGA06035.1 hypothetical protein GCM10011408_28720 [Dyella caseinilytica]